MKTVEQLLGFNIPKKHDRNVGNVLTTSVALKLELLLILQSTVEKYTACQDSPRELTSDHVTTWDNDENRQ